VYVCVCVLLPVDSGVEGRLGRGIVRTSCSSLKSPGLTGGEEQEHPRQFGQQKLRSSFRWFIAPTFQFRTLPVAAEFGRNPWEVDGEAKEVHGRPN
jgi:hypothetical protein